ncbi:MAG: DUF983 domain-containing protein [Pararhizobium sp.]
MEHFGADVHKPGRETARFEAAPGKSGGERDLGQALKRGFRNRCPHCGEGRLFRAFLKPVDHCAVCGEAMHHHRSDDLPAYLVVVIVGHVMVGGWLGTEMLWHLSSWQHLAIWGPVTASAAVLLLQPVKGAVIGLQWANRMHGFGNAEDDPATAPLGETIR